MACVEKSCILSMFYVGGAELYHNLTAKVKASVRSLIASGPQFHLRIRCTDPVPTRFRPGSDSGRKSAYCATRTSNHRRNKAPKGRPVLGLSPTQGPPGMAHGFPSRKHSPEK